VLLHPSGAIAAIDYWTISGGSAYTYEPDTHRLATATSWNASGTLQDLGFDYDLAGNLTGVNDALDELDQVFTYDGLHRLATATGTGSSGYGALGFGYDAAGNLKSKGAIGSPLLLSYAGGNAGPHGVTGVTGAETGSFVYDGDGQVTARTRSGGTQALIRDDDGRIREVPYFAEYVYDETGERARKQTFSGAGDTLYVDPEFEVDLVNATHEIHYFHGSRRVATERRSGLGLPGGGGAGSLLSRQFYFPDFVGSNSVVARNDGTLQKTFFRPFGEFAQTGSNLTPYLFTDQEHDPETNLQYFGARYYDPRVGRFMEPDPALIGPASGAAFNLLPSNPQILNAYALCTQSAHRARRPKRRVPCHTVGRGRLRNRRVQCGHRRKRSKRRERHRGWGRCRGSSASDHPRWRRSPGPQDRSGHQERIRQGRRGDRHEVGSQGDDGDVKRYKDWARTQ
jgi:RHS repeat-associated protein